MLRSAAQGSIIIFLVLIAQLFVLPPTSFAALRVGRSSHFEIAAELRKLRADLAASLNANKFVENEQKSPTQPMSSKLKTPSAPLLRSLFPQNAPLTVATAVRCEENVNVTATVFAAAQARKADAVLTSWSLAALHECVRPGPYKGGRSASIDYVDVRASPMLVPLWSAQHDVLFIVISSSTTLQEISLLQLTWANELRFGVNLLVVGDDDISRAGLEMTTLPDLNEKGLRGHVEHNLQRALIAVSRDARYSHFAWVFALNGRTQVKLSALSDQLFGWNARNVPMLFSFIRQDSTTESYAQPSLDAGMLMSRPAVRLFAKHLYGNTCPFLGNSEQTLGACAWHSGIALVQSAPFDAPLELSPARLVALESVLPKIGQFGDTGRKPHVVVSAFHEDLEWVFGLSAIGWNVSIYHKQPARALALRAEILRRQADNIIVNDIENWGDEALPYLQFIVEHFDALPPAIAFLHGNPQQHAPFYLDMLRCLDPLWIQQMQTNPFQGTAHGYFSLNHRWVGGRDVVNSEREGYLFILLTRFINEQLEMQGADLRLRKPTLISFYCCAQFVVSPLALLRAGKVLWTVLLHAASLHLPNGGDRKTTAYFFEHVWHELLGQQQHLDRILASPADIRKAPFQEQCYRAADGSETAFARHLRHEF